MDEDIKRCCRICLDVENEHVSILGDPTIHLHLKSCLGIAVSSNDCLPKLICGSCTSQLSDFYNFQLNARCSQDWLESNVQERVKKSTETKTPIQPLPDSEYNSDSLLEFLNNTANIEEYLNNLGKEDIPSIVNLLDRNENSIPKPTKVPTPKKKDVSKENTDMNMEIDEIIIVKEVIVKKPDIKVKNTQTMSNQKQHHTKPDKNPLFCFACDDNFDNIHKLTQHMSICDLAPRTCNQCNMLFDSKLKMQQHFIIEHNASSLTCNCGKQFQTRENLVKHHKTCLIDHGASMGCSYRCKECGETFKERFLLYRHAKEHIMKSEQRICDICGHSFIGSEALSKHRTDEHEKPDNLIYRCKVCSFTSNDRKETYIHVKSHMQTSKQNSTRHLCESCGRSFSTPASLHRHSLQHEKVKEFMCSICGKQFLDEKSRDDHKLDHGKMIMCERCGQTVNSYNIDVHRCI